MNHVVKTKGFTLIELMLAMSFISVLLIAIALTILQIGNIYNRGLTLKQVDQSGQSVASELQSAIGQSAPFSITSGTGSRYIQQTWGGRLCLGQYSYIWNYGKALQTQNATLNVYTSGSTAQIHLVKVLDQGATYCLQPSSKIDPTKAVELLNTGDHELAIHAFTISSAASAIDTKTSQQLYDIEFVLGTNDQSALTYDSNGMASCSVPGVPGADPTYCAINIFDIVARAGNAVQ